MESRFGRRLFRLFLAFSLLPLIAMGVIGYYLATESIEIVSQDQPTASEGAIRYYNDYITDRIDSALAQFYRNDTAVDLNFLVMYGSTSGTDTILRAGDLDTEDVATLISQARREPKGVWHGDSMTYQYSSMPTSGHTVLMGGVIHRMNLDSLMANLQSGISARAARREARFGYLTFLGLLFALLALLSGVVAYLFSRKLSQGISHPLTDLSLATEKIADGDFSVRTPVSGGDEIGELQRTFNDMAGRLEVTTAQLAQTERVAAWRNIARRLAHDLKNPLQPIIISLFQMEKSLADTSEYPRVKEPLRAAKEELEQLKVLAERFSSLAKLPLPQVETVDLGKLLAQVTDLYLQQLGKDRISCSLPSESVEIDCDETYLREILHNLIKNSVEAIGDTGNIEIGMKSGASKVQVIIRDTGKGMDRETLASARQPYFTTKSEGSGLGLAVVEKTLAEMGGNLLIESSAGVGTTVTVDFPRKAG